MAQFIAWIYAQASKVYMWFGAAFTALYNGAAHAWDWAVGKAMEAYNSAVSFALSIKTSIISTLTVYVDWLKARIDDLRQGVIEDITALIDWVEYRISTIGDFAGSVITNTINAVYEFVDGVKNTIIDIINNSIDWVWDRVIGAYGWLLSIRDDLLRLISVFNPQTVTALLSLLGSWMQTVMLFFNNPLGFIFDVTREKFISFVCYIFAWGLGTTKYELPKNPPWKG